MAPTNRPWRRWYNTRAWARIREARLSSQPLCKFCKARGYITPATVVDHTKPHRGDYATFFDYDNTQSLCKPCHDGTKQQQEVKGYTTEVGKDGLPVDPNHPFFRNATRTGGGE